MLDERWSGEAEEVGVALRKLLAQESSIARVRAAEASEDGTDAALDKALLDFGLNEPPDEPELLARVAFELGRAIAPTTWVESAPALLVCGEAQTAYGFEGDTPAALARIALATSDGVRLENLKGERRRTAAGDFLVRHISGGEGRHIGDAAAGDKMRRLMRLLDSARLVGAAEAMLEYGVEYAKQREQFGKPIGAFQAVAHRLVNARVAIDAADLLVRKAAFVAGAGGAGDGAPPWIFATMARARAVESARLVADNVHQVFGGAGFALECDCQLYSRRIRNWALRLSRPGPELADLARNLLDASKREGVRGLWHFDQGMPLPRWARQADALSGDGACSHPKNI